MVTKSKTTKEPSTALVNYDEELRKEAEGIAKTIGSVTGRNISTRNKTFTLPDGRAHKGSMKVVILDYVNKNLMYDRAYREGERIPPICFAISKDLSIMAPSANAPDPQSEQCTGCPMNEFGSSGPGKACKNTVVLALAAPDGKSKEVMLLSVSPTGLANWNKYVAGVKAKFNSVPVKVVTEVTFDDAVEYPKLQFEVSAPNEDLQYHWGLREEARQMLQQEPDLSVATKTAPSKVPVKRPVPTRR